MSHDMSEHPNATRVRALEIHELVWDLCAVDAFWSA
jgi:hypothetical protein